MRCCALLSGHVERRGRGQISNQSTQGGICKRKARLQNCPSLVSEVVYKMQGDVQQARQLRPNSKSGLSYKQSIQTSQAGQVTTAKQSQLPNNTSTVYGSFPMGMSKVVCLMRQVVCLISFAAGFAALRAFTEFAGCVILLLTRLTQLVDVSGVKPTLPQDQSFTGVVNSINALT